MKALEHSEATRYVYRFAREQVIELVPWFLDTNYWFNIEYASDGTFWLTCAIPPNRLPDHN